MFVKDEEIIDQYVRLTPFLAHVLGQGCEVVVHDLTKPGHTLAAVYNSPAARTVGDPLSQPAQALLTRAAGEKESFCPGTLRHTEQGDVLSYAYYIRNQNRLIGLLCISKSLSDAQELSLVVNKLLDRFGLTCPEANREEESDTVTALMRSRIAEEVAACGALPARLSLQEKVKIVHHLQDAGILRMKGAIPEIAKQLGVSVPTVYRYLNKEAQPY